MFTCVSGMAGPGIVHLKRMEKDISETVKEFTQLRGEDSFVDVTVKLDGETLKCHKVILATFSPFLKAMLLSGMQESKKGEISLNNFPAKAVKIIIDSMYSLGDVVVDEEDMQDVLTAADYLQMYTLRDKCASEITVTAKNVLSLYNFAESVNMQKLKQKCSEFMKKHFKEVVEESEFPKLDKSEVIDVLQHGQQLCEDVKLRSVFLWASHDTVNRSRHLDDLMEAVKLAECSPSAMNSVLQQYEEVMFSNRRLHQSLTSSISSLKQVVAIIGGYDSYDFQRKVWTVNDSNQVEKLCVMPDDVQAGYSVCAIPMGVALTGGDGSKMCLIYNARTNSWSRMQDMSDIRHSHGSICVDGVLYVLGGYTFREERSASVESMSLASKAWTQCASLPVSIGNPLVASIGISIFVLDRYGRNQLFKLNNNDNSRWIERAPLLASISNKYARMCSVDDKLCVVGGRSRACAWYHPDTDTWVEAQQKPRLHHVYGAAVVVSGNILLLGGDQFGDGTDESESFGCEGRKVV